MLKLLSLYLTLKKINWGGVDTITEVKVQFGRHIINIPHSVSIVLLIVLVLIK